LPANATKSARSQTLDKLAPVHCRAVGQLQFAVEADRAVRVKPKQPLDEQSRTPLVGNRPEQVEIRLGGQVGQPGCVLPEQGAEHARRHSDCLAEVD
jgi:hypothetical protein